MRVADAGSQGRRRQRLARLAVVLGILGASGTTVALVATANGPQAPTVTVTGSDSAVVSGGVTSAGLAPSVIEPFVPTTTTP